MTEWFDEMCRDFYDWLTAKIAKMQQELMDA